MKTKAAILTKQKSPLVIAEIEVPRLQKGQVLVEVHYASICGQQIDEVNGTKGPDPYLPHLLGHEGAGRVQQVGEGVTHIKSGDTVVMHWRKGSGIEGPPAQYPWEKKLVNAGRITCFQNFSVVSENRLTVIPNTTNLETAPLYGCCLTTAFGVVKNDAGLREGESVVIFGAGGMGLAEVIAAKLARAHPIVAVDRYDHKLAMAQALGATHAVNTAKDHVRKKIQSIIGTRGADVTIENTGKGSVIEIAYELAGPQGRTILVGVPSSLDKATIDTLPLHFGKILTGSHGGNACPQEDVPHYLQRAQEGEFDASRLITHRFALSEINEAFDAMRCGDAVRCLIDTREVAAS